jgi:multisubunit Na+/H+ antiporter MnhC subunit
MLLYTYNWYGSALVEGIGAELTAARVGLHVVLGLSLCALAVFGVFLDTRGLEWAPAVGVIGFSLICFAAVVWVDIRKEHVKDKL